MNFRQWTHSMMAHRKAPQDVRDMMGDEFVNDMDAAMWFTFADGAWILVTQDDKFYTHAGCDEVEFDNFGEIADYLWSNHSQFNAQ